MDYKEKYEKCLKKAREVYDKIPDSTLGLTLAGIFPELAESEDEKIRKDIISFLRSKNGYMNPDEDWDFHNRWLPWLEKQGKQKSITSDIPDELPRLDYESLQKELGHSVIKTSEQ